MMSVTSSVTPAMVSNSWRASSKRTWVIGRTGDRRQQRAAQGVAERVAEAGLERADGERLAVALGLADRLDGGALDDEHDLPRELGGGGDGLLAVELDDELLAHGHVDLLAQRELAHGDGLAAVTGLEPGREAPSSVSRLCRMTIIAWLLARRATTSPLRTR